MAETSRGPFCWSFAVTLLFTLSTWRSFHTVYAAELHHEIALADCGKLKDYLRSIQNAQPPAANETSAADWASHPIHGYSRSENECWSRAEWHCFRDAAGVPHPSSLLLHMLHRYRERWRFCNEAENATSLRDKLLGGTRPLCKYILWHTPSDGMGNRLINLVSTFAYALVTGRILLIDANQGGPSDLFCEPFPDAPSWVFQQLGQVAAAPFSRTVDYANCSILRESPPLVLDWTVLHLFNLTRYFCADYHLWAEGAPVLLASGNQYYAPTLYFVPQFRRVLRALFPSGRVFATLAPLLLHPKNSVWARTTAFLLAHADEGAFLVGVQFRKGHNAQSGAAHVGSCIARLSNSSLSERAETKHTLALPGLDSVAKGPTNSPGGIAAGGGGGGGGGGAAAAGVNRGLVVFVATMDEAFVPALQGELERRGLAPPVYTLSQDHSQKTVRLEHNEHALYDVVTLGLASDLLFTSPISTFGYLVAGFSSAPAVFVGDKCDPAPGEPCFQAAPWGPIRCCDGGGAEAAAVDVRHHVAEVQQCVDHQYGVSVNTSAHVPRGMAG